MHGVHNCVGHSSLLCSYLDSLHIRSCMVSYNHHGAAVVTTGKSLKCGRAAQRCSSKMPKGQPYIDLCLTSAMCISLGPVTPVCWSKLGF
jgi:hypothetical protein